jgi:hypothetical protein
LLRSPVFSLQCIAPGLAQPEAMFLIAHKATALPL